MLPYAYAFLKIMILVHAALVSWNLNFWLYVIHALHLDIYDYRSIDRFSAVCMLDWTVRIGTLNCVLGLAIHDYSSIYLLPSSQIGRLWHGRKAIGTSQAYARPWGNVCYNQCTTCIRISIVNLTAYSERSYTYQAAFNLAVRDAQLCSNCINCFPSELCTHACIKLILWFFFILVYIIYIHRIDRSLVYRF